MSSTDTFTETALLENFRQLRPMLRVDGQTLDTGEFLTGLNKSIALLRKQKRLPEYFMMPLGIQFELTSRCNQKCLTCYNRSNDLEFHNVAADLTTEEWLKVAEDVHKLEPFEIIISGGEPLLLGDGLWKIMDVFKERKPMYVFITNGMLVTEQVVKKLRTYTYGWIQVSIDGVTPPIHDHLRQAPGSWYKAVRAAQLIRDADLPLVISHTITSLNAETLADMIDFSYQIGAKRIVTGPYLNSGRAILNDGQLRLSESQVKACYQTITKKTKEYFGRFSVAQGAEASYSHQYNAIMRSRTILIRPNGDVKLDCCLPFIIGNVRNETIRDMWSKRGTKAYEASNVVSYIKQIRSDADIPNVEPRPYVDQCPLVDEVR